MRELCGEIEVFYIAVGYGLHGSIHLSNLHEDSYDFGSRCITGRMYNNWSGSGQIWIRREWRTLAIVKAGGQTTVVHYLFYSLCMHGEFSIVKAFKL